MKSLVLTIVGNDKPGLIESLAKLVFQHKGNWLASNFSHMAGHFAGFAEVSVPESEEASLLQAFEQHPDLTIFMSQGLSSANQSSRALDIEIVGNDKPGIVQEVTGVLNRFNLNITSFDSSCGSAPNWGNSIFQAKVKVELPQEFNCDELQDSLENIANDLMVEIKLAH